LAIGVSLHRPIEILESDLLEDFEITNGGLTVTVLGELVILNGTEAALSQGRGPVWPWSEWAIGTGAA
jgi:hypothetical protein